MKVVPFSIRIEDAALVDLKGRLARTRWPDEINDDDWTWGTRSDYLRRLVGYWASGFDWRAQETELNRLPQFQAEFDGLRIHFVHIRGSGPACFPLVLTHGWPGSFIEMRKIIPLLTDRPRMAARRRTRSMWWRHRFPVSGSPTVQAKQAHRLPRSPISG